MGRLSSWGASRWSHNLESPVLVSRVEENNPLGCWDRQKGQRSPDFTLKEYTHAALPIIRQREPCIGSCHLPTLLKPNEVNTLDLLTLHHSIAQDLGQPALGKDRVQLHRDKPGGLKCDPGRVVAAIVTTLRSTQRFVLQQEHPGPAHSTPQLSAGSEAYRSWEKSALTTSRTLVAAQTPQFLQLKHPNTQSPSTPNQSTVLDLGQTQQGKGCDLGLLLSGAMDAYTGKAQIFCEQSPPSGQGMFSRAMEPD